MFMVLTIHQDSIMDIVEKEDNEGRERQEARDFRAFRKVIEDSTP